MVTGRVNLAIVSRVVGADAAAFSDSSVEGRGGDGLSVHAGIELVDGQEARLSMQALEAASAPPARSGKHAGKVFANEPRIECLLIHLSVQPSAADQKASSHRAYLPPATRP